MLEVCGGGCCKRCREDARRWGPKGFVVVLHLMAGYLTFRCPSLRVLENHPGSLWSTQIFVGVNPTRHSIPESSVWVFGLSQIQAFLLWMEP